MASFVPGGPVERRLMQIQMAASQGGRDHGTRRRRRCPRTPSSRFRAYTGFDKPITSATVQLALGRCCTLELALSTTGPRCCTSIPEGAALPEPLDVADVDWLVEAVVRANLLDGVLGQRLRAESREPPPATPPSDLHEPPFDGPPRHGTA